MSAAALAEAGAEAAGFADALVFGADVDGLLEPEVAPVLASGPQANRNNGKRTMALFMAAPGGEETRSARRAQRR
jgi:hypothetical protein